jgi:hypothetical protein
LRRCGGSDRFTLKRGHDLAQRRQIRLESSGVIEVGVGAKKLEAAGLVGGAELGQEQSRNRRERTCTGRKKFGLHETHRDPSSEMPPPAAGVPALGAAGLGLSLVGSASASALATADLPQSLNTTPNQRFVLGEEEMADVSLATFQVFDKENGTGGFTQVARGCGGCGRGGGCGGGGCRGCGCRGCGCGGCGGWAAAVTEAAAHRGAVAVIVESMQFLAHWQS